MTADPHAGPDVEVRAYARQVRAALADLPAARVAELLEDLEEHLVEVAAEGGEPLADRLGPASGYAAELRRSAGLGEPPAAGAPAGPARTPWHAELTAGLARAQRSRPWLAVQEFLPELRPAWWVVRAWAALVALDALLLGSTSFPVPTFGTSPLIGLLLTGAAVTWSVRRGLRVREDPSLGRARLAVAGNAALALLALVAVFGAGGQPEPAMASYPGPEPGDAELAHEDGTPITNIHPYSSTGEPLEGVLLYDQDGRPIDNLAEYTEDGDEVQRIDADPPAPANAFPQRQRVLTWDEFGRETWVEQGPAPVDPAPVEPAPVDPAPVEPEPVVPTPVQPVPAPPAEPTP
ncbi:hypothetical protein JKP75_02765 [Blastococcus sp. TML/M2B]|uniref:HAAS signaling domain-containing protein n=1 Tax=unclassified Blastococcus TaxID=2619396 RepID=UPI00190D878F|nr:MULTISPECIES: hypothetical protein [unclassified Blastococcus]MBN1091591.1 hypothetical protein [Blastococcus sp. TML/M2B]MBN1094857.1 hypothetical protein [Blastococcus sp. TML/C7B]